jgi:hypothetical protein
MPRSMMMELCLHFLIRLHGAVANPLSTGTALLSFIPYSVLLLLVVLVGFHVKGIFFVNTMYTHMIKTVIALKESTLNHGNSVLVKAIDGS